jgi:hypothetical protein
MIRTRMACLLAVSLCLAGPRVSALQTPEAPARRVVAASEVDDVPNATVTRERLEQLLRQYPPAVGEVLQRDPSLLNRPDYLSPYPALTAFLAEHPEVARNPRFFLGAFEVQPRDPQHFAEEMIESVFAALAAAAAVVAFIGLLVWLIRAVIDHRRWLRLSRVQTEVHTKLMDRLATTEDLLAYIQSPAGRRFLESAPIALDGEPRRASAPFGAILWSLQAGIVLVALGLGLLFAQRSVLQEIADGFYILGVLAIALGIGFAGSAVAAYLISTRFGLMPASKLQSNE